MRKVLLATTALVAMTGAASAEVALSGYYEFGYTSVEDDLTVDRDTTFTEGEIHVNFSNVTDSGLTLGYHTEIVTHMHSANSTGNQIDDSYMSIAGDFGTFRLGENDTIESTFATFHPGGRNMITGDDWTAQVRDADNAAVTDGDLSTVVTGLRGSATGGAYADNANVTYISPEMGGFTFGISYAARDSGTTGGEYQAASDTGDNDDTVIGASYATDMAGASVSLQAHVQDNAESGTDKVKKTAYGTNIGFGDLSLAVSKVDYEESTTTDSDTLGYGIGYQINDSISVAANLVNSETTVSGVQHDLDITSFSLSYDIAPGLNFAIALNNADYKDGGDAADNMKSDEMRASLQASF
jgi:outer membrane protein OmpU